jgi:hypothetical protein
MSRRTISGVAAIFGSLWSSRPLGRTSASVMAVSKRPPSTHMATCPTFARIPITPALFMTGVIVVSGAYSALATLPWSNKKAWPDVRKPHTRQYRSANWASLLLDLECGLDDPRITVGPVVAVPRDQPHAVPVALQPQPEPSYFTSWSQSGPSGTMVALVGRQNSNMHRT